MSRLKGSMLLFVPLCLKFHGRIVGAVSKMTMTVYIGVGMLVISSVLLLIVSFGVIYNPTHAVRSEQGKEQSITAAQQTNQPAVISVSSQAMPEITPRAMDTEVAKEMIVISELLKGQIKLDFGWQFHEIYKDWRYHTGLDIDASAGQAVEAAYTGEVTDIVRDKHSGLTVVVKDNTYTIYYGSLSEITVEKGTSIRAGQKIGEIGSCDAEPYPHLHIAIKKEGQYIDPKVILNK